MRTKSQIGYVMLVNLACPLVEEQAFLSGRRAGMSRSTAAFLDFQHNPAHHTRDVFGQRDLL